jgi:hypothetical protein
MVSIWRKGSLARPLQKQAFQIVNLIKHPSKVERGVAMTVGNAMTFIKRAMTDSELRERLNTASSIEARDEILTDERLPFSQYDFEEAFRNRLTLCQEAEAADQLNEFKMWWELLTTLLNSGACANTCNRCSG